MKLQLVISGSNFLFNGDAGFYKGGFYVNLIVESDNLDDAIESGVSIIQGNTELKKMTYNAPNDPPLISLNESYEVLSDCEISTSNNINFILYKE